MPRGAVWVMLMLSAVVVAVGCWFTSCGDQEFAIIDVDPEEPIALGLHFVTARKSGLPAPPPT
jgi:hypothetical protein